ncbi:MAG: HD domain-containing protein [Bacteroidota bacterium]
MVLSGKQQDIIDKTISMIREKFSGEGTGHDWWHIQRVVEVSAAIAKEENADLFIVQMGALLHDIADHKFHNNDHTIGPEKAKEWMAGCGMNEDEMEPVLNIVKEISFKGAKVATPMSSKEGEIVQDADRLDALGAIGIARAFAYGGSKNREIYNPESEPVLHTSFEEYKNAGGNTIGHFYEKLLLLKDRMNTATGKKIAEQRHLFMENYLEQFYAEWKGMK